jgi:hypothetical protein
MGEITVKEVKSRKDLREFIYLPEMVHRNEPDWLPPLYMDEWELYDKKKNKSFRYADGLLLLAYRDNKPVGRIMGIINRRYNEINHENHGRFCFMECYNDQAVFHTLISSIEEWARQNGMSRLVGPLGFSDKDPQGFQTEGIRYPQFIQAPTILPIWFLSLRMRDIQKKLTL